MRTRSGSCSNRKITEDGARYVAKKKKEKERLCTCPSIGDGKSYAALRGAAYGLAGCVKGLGIGALRQYDILTTLGNAVEDKKSISARQGGLLGV